MATFEKRDWSKRVARLPKNKRGFGIRSCEMCGTKFMASGSQQRFCGIFNKTGCSILRVRERARINARKYLDARNGARPRCKHCGAIKRAAFFNNPNDVEQLRRKDEGNLLPNPEDDGPNAAGNL